MLLYFIAGIIGSAHTNSRSRSQTHAPASKELLTQRSPPGGTDQRIDKFHTAPRSSGQEPLMCSIKCSTVDLRFRLFFRFQVAALSISSPSIHRHVRRRFFIGNIPSNSRWQHLTCSAGHGADYRDLATVVRSRALRQIQTPDGIR